MTPLTSAEKQRRRRQALDEIAAAAGYESHYKMMTAIANREAEVLPVLRKGDRVVVYTVTGTVQGATGTVTEFGPDANWPGKHWYRVEFDEPVMGEEGIPTRKLDCSRGELIRTED